MQFTRLCIPGFLFGIAALGLMHADERDGADSSARPDLTRTWSATLQTGFAPTFQMTLGGMFGDGPDWQNKVVVNLHNALRDGDSVSVFGWNTLDMRVPRRNWQSGLLYKTRVLQNRRHTLTLGGGVERWLLPSVKSGARDWLASGYLSYGSSVKGVPILVTQDSWSLLRSTLPTGTVLFTQIQTQRPLYKGEHAQVALRHGAQHTYSWGFYGTQGNRVVRYGASLALTWKSTVFEGGYRQQFGLQDGIRYNRFWSFSITRRIAGSFDFMARRPN
jgi:hypothetical protein